jgi:hypothetical protein
MQDSNSEMSTQIIALKDLHRFAGIQPNSGFGDYSRLSCGVGDTLSARGRLVRCALSFFRAVESASAFNFVMVRQWVTSASRSQFHSTTKTMRGGSAADFPTRFPTELLTTGSKMVTQNDQWLAKKALSSKQNGTGPYRSRWAARV